MSHKESGFSLIEIAMSLMVVGVLIGATLKGRDIILRARLHKTLSQITQIQLGKSVFQERYGALPGDFGKATQLWGADTFDGNQDGHVSGLGRAPQQESTGFWNHLALSGLISGGKTSDPLFTHSLPTTPVGGEFTVEEDPDGLSGLWLILGKANGDRNTGPLLTPAQASFLDGNLDDGAPHRGRIQAREGHGIQAGQCVRDGTYRLDVTDPTCILYVALE